MATQTTDSPKSERLPLTPEEQQLLETGTLKDYEIQAHPRDFYKAISNQVSAAWAGPVTREMALPVAASVRLVSACQDNQVALDGMTNGLFTGRLLETWGEGAFQGDYAAFHRAIVERMPPDQTPNHYQTGQPSPAYAAQRPFDI